MLENVSIILVEPAGDENVGMAARAMKNCGLTDLRLVKPVPFKTRGAKKWACNALDVLAKARVYKDLEDAISDVSLVVALSRREGRQRPPLLSHDKAASTILKRAKKGRVALIFGREADGLDRKELALCDMVWTIPTSKGYPSLNLAQAVLLASHELFECLSLFATRRNLQVSQEIATPATELWRARNDLRSFVPKKEVKPVLKELYKALTYLGYDDRENGKLRKKIMNEFERLFDRGGLFRKNVNMFMGLTARIKQRTKQ
jgi:tRNA/rRNA methyltransferase